MVTRSALWTVILTLMLATVALAAQTGQSGGQTGQPQRINISNLIGADSIKGMHVNDRNGQDVGEVERVLINARTGRTEALVLGYGGFLDIGDKQVAIPYQAFTLNQAGGLVLNATEEQLKEAPKYNPNTQYSQDYGSRVYGYWGYPYDSYAWNDSWGWGGGYNYYSDYGLGEDTMVVRPGALGGTQGQQGQQQARQSPQAQAGSGPWTGTVRRMGESWVLVNPQGVPFQLKGDQASLGKLEGQKVQVSGSLSGATIAVKDIKPSGQSGQMGGSQGQQGQQGQKKQ